VDLKLNVRYVAPADRGASWYASSLAELRRSRARDAIRIELRGGGVVGGFVDDTSESPCVIYLEDQHPIPCEDIAAFTLLEDPDSSGPR
jgi:hypothetical protein